MTTRQPTPPDQAAANPPILRVNSRWLLAAAALAGCVVWAYWPTLAGMAHEWATRSENSHGFLVPIFAVVLLYLRRQYLNGISLQPNLGGLVLLLAGAALRLAGAYGALEWFDGLSLLPFLAGLVLLVGGWPALRWAWPSIAFLFFMIPLPFRVQTALAGPLQSLATTVATYVMQTIGLPALAEGNVIRVEGVPPIGVVEACSGLNMLVTFFALTTAVVILSQRPIVDRVIIFLSAMPIAVASNVIRITCFALLHVWLNDTALDLWFRQTVSPKGIADQVFHEWAGWLMMLWALGFLWLELKLLSLLLLEREGPAQPIPAPAR